MERIEMNVGTGEQQVVALTEEEVAAAQEAALANQPSYAQLRRAAYPAIGDQLDAMMQWVLAQDSDAVPEQLAEIAEACAQVKRRYPKPVEVDGYAGA